MTDEGKLSVQKDRGQRAKRLLENELIQEFFEQYENRIWETFRQSGLHDDVGQKTCRLHVKVLDDFREHFQKLISSGEYAEAKLVEARKKGLFRR